MAILRRFPSAFTVLFGVTVAVWLLAFVIPPGAYEVDAEGRPRSGTYHRLDVDRSFGDRLHDLFIAPINGLYGVKSAKTGVVGPDQVGELYGSAAVFLFVLAMGAFIGVTFASGALDRGIGRLAHRLRHRGQWLIVGLMAVFSLAGTVEGFAEETLGFYGLVVPLMLALGYDRMVAAAAIILGAGVGVMASTINPFATGVASAAASVSLGDGAGLRLILWVGLTALVIGYVLRYAKRVKADPSRSLVGMAEPASVESAAAPPPLTRRHVVVLCLVGLTFALMIFSIIPWAAIFGGPGAKPYPWQLGWYFPELTALFLVAAVVVGFVGGLGEEGTVAKIISGAGDFVSAGLVIVLARGVTVIMNNAHVTDTVLHSLESAVSSTSSGVFAVMIFLLNIPLAFLIPSTSGHATLAMPILAPLSDFAGVPRSLTITAWQAASGLMNLVTPTAAVIMGGLALAKVGYDKYLRFTLPLLGILLAVISAALFTAAVL